MIDALRATTPSRPFFAALAAVCAAGMLAMGCGGGSTECRDGCNCGGECRACPCPQPLVEEDDAGNDASR